MDRVLKKTGIRVIKFDPMKKSFYNGIWGGFYTVASSNMTDMPGQGKVKRSSAVLPVYIDKKSHIELGVSGKGFKLGAINSPQVLKRLKSFKKSDLEEGLGDMVGKSIGKYNKKRKKNMDALKKLKKKESVNEFKTIYNKNKAAMKIRSLQRDKAAKVYKVDKKRTKYQGKDLIVYNLFTKNKNHSTNQNPYGLDMMKGAYLIPVEESIDVTENLDKNRAQVLLRQLGGNKFIAMTGAKNFTLGKEGLGFKIGRNSKAVNHVQIQLNGKDLYDMTFRKGTRVLNTANDVYGDQLQKMFTKYTGMYTRL